MLEVIDFCIGLKYIRNVLHIIIKKPLLEDVAEEANWWET